MTKKVVRKPRGAAASMRAAASVAAPVAAGNVLASIFASIRDGQAPWTLDELPADTGASEVLLSELDRLWQNPLPN
jgi:hypothetical protein